ncbi:MAG: hypothetical protein WCT01_01575 [Candidatus Shapirobacteria bacterium]
MSSLFTVKYSAEKDLQNYIDRLFSTRSVDYGSDHFAFVSRFLPPEIMKFSKSYPKL